MNARPRDLPPGLDELLGALRAAGLPVGAREVLRLHRVFALEPRLEQEREGSEQLRRILTAALVHSPTEQEIFDPVYRAWNEHLDRWQPTLDDDHRDPKPSLKQENIEPAFEDWRERRDRWQLTSELYKQEQGPPLTLTLPRPHKPKRWLGLLAVVVAIDLASIAISWLMLPRAPEPVSTEAVSTEPVTTEEIKLDFEPLPPPPVGGFVLVEPGEEAAEPTADIAPDSSSDSGMIFLPVAGLALLSAAGFLIRIYEGRRRRPPPAERPTLPGPRRVPYLPLPETRPELLDGEGAGAMIWGVDRYRTEDSTPEIDLERTVAETARSAGIPKLCFEPEKRLREIWLWVDGLVEDPTLERYVDEIAAALEAAGLPARIAGFDAYPLELVWDEGQRFRPQELEGHRQTAVVAVLTDGAVLAQHAHDHHRGQVQALLRSLKTWERLTFVDFSPERDLGKLLAKHGLVCVAPESLPYFLGQREAAPIPRRADPVEVRAWATALTLSPRTVTATEAYALRREMGFEVSPWALRSFAGTTATPRDLRWLRDASRRKDRKPSSTERLLASDSPLGLALDFWQQRLDDEDERRLERGALESWKNRPARRYLEMEQAFLELWRDPDAATEKLVALAEDASLAIEIRLRLSAHAPEGAAMGEESIPLPWHPGELEPITRERLGELGLTMNKGTLRTPGGLGLAMGLLAGLGLFFLTQGIRDLISPDQVAPEVVGDCPPLAHEHEAIGMRFVRVCAGSFQMGSSDDPLADDDEKPAHRVDLSEFWIGEREVSNAEYRLWRGDDESEEKAAADLLPAVNVTWHEARQYCRWLGQSETGGEYDLPTEAQWEYAARGPESHRYPWGNAEPTEELAAFAPVDGIAIVGSKPQGAGPFGTLDQAGNVWEWVRDCYDADVYADRADQVVEDPAVMGEGCLTVGEFFGDQILEGWSESSVSRVLRGGSAWGERRNLRSANRDEHGPPGVRIVDVGFRCLRVPHRQP